MHAMHVRRLGVFETPDALEDINSNHDPLKGLAQLSLRRQRQRAQQQLDFNY